MLLSADQRRALGSFLRSQRERLRADDAGPPGPRAGRRRTPGLRREEVAQLSGVSPTWYAWIEQGRDISVSVAALARVAGALRLSPAERGYLFELARRRDPAAPEVGAAEREGAAELRPVLEALTQPAYLLDPLWRALAWNAPARELFADWLGGAAPSLLDYVFGDPRARSFIPDWPDRARRIAAEFRADTAGRPGDPRLRAVVERLSALSTDFASVWADHSVLAREGGARAFQHPGQGLVRYTQTTLTPAGWLGCKLVVLVRLPDAAATAPSRGPEAEGGEARAAHDEDRVNARK